MSGRESMCQSVEREIARQLEEIQREDSRPLLVAIPQDQALLSDELSNTSRLLRGALVVSVATVVIRIVSPYLAWIAAWVIP